jgi:hypothetical protein
MRKIHTNKTQREEYIEFIVHKSLQNLVWLKIFVLDTGLILPNPLDGHPALFFAESFRCDRGVREKNEHDNAP